MYARICNGLRSVKGREDREQLWIMFMQVSHDVSTRGPYKQRERAYVAEWVRNRYPNDRAMFNERLGGIPSQFEGVDVGGLSSNIFKVYDRYADAIVVKPDKLIMIEAKIKANLGAVSQLEYYASLIKSTPVLAPYADLPVELRIVTVSAEQSFISFANAHGVAIDIYRPPWAVDYLASVLK